MLDMNDHTLGLAAHKREMEKKLKDKGYTKVDGGLAENAYKKKFIDANKTPKKKLLDMDTYNKVYKDLTEQK